MGLADLGARLLADAAAPASRGARAPGFSWLADPRAAVLLVLAALVIAGSLRQLRRAWAARRALERLNDPDVTAAEVEESARHGRAAITDLFRLLDTAPDRAVRMAAGRGLASLWKADELVVEEEKAVATRGFEVVWKARRRYPRVLRGPIPFGVAFGIPFLDGAGDQAEDGRLVWSYRITGTGRATLETFRQREPGWDRVVFEIEPEDFASNGPHRLVLQARLHASRGSSAWQLDLPHVPFPFEFDPRLAVESLYCAPDDAMGEQVARSVLLAPPPSEAGADPKFLPLGETLALRDPPRLHIRPGLPRDLAHRVWLEFEGIAGRFQAGQVVVAVPGDGLTEARSAAIGPLAGTSPETDLGRPGTRRLRAILVPDPELGWADPEVRALWPGTLTTEWVEAQVVRL
jgi:hypothetical protein